MFDLCLFPVVAVPMLMYTGWQIGYLLITEVVLASWIRSDKEITFALRYQ